MRHCFRAWMNKGLICNHMCYTKPFWLFQATLLDYAKAADPHFNNSRVLMAISFSISTIVVILEMICYILFFWTIYKHNSGSSVLPMETKKSRNRANAQTMMGQIYFFMLDITYMLFNAFALGPGAQIISGTSKDIVVTLKTLDIAIVSVTHCLFITEIRHKIMKPFVNIKNSLSLAVNSIIRFFIHSFIIWIR